MPLTPPTYDDHVPGSPSSRRDVPVILYFCYGPDQIYYQAIYSILSLLYVQRGAPRGCRVVAYCDRPEMFAALPVEAVTIDEATLDAWLNGSDYVHRRKTCALIDALERFGGKVIFVDSDTYFRRPPEPVFTRVGPGRACFHICEGFVRATGTPFDRALAAQIDSGNYRLPSGRAVAIGRRTRMWNTGVVGVDASDLWRVRDALALSDAIWADADPDAVDGRKIHHGEQFAMGYAFDDCRLAEAADCIYHYWLSQSKSAFNTLLPRLVAQGLGDQSPSKIGEIYHDRCRLSGVGAYRDRIKMAVRRAALVLGIPVKGVRRSVA